jgi:anion-transporting  ArsA/GET3 family ATPase
VTHKLLQDVIFVLGKGGTGRTSVACALAKSLADKGQKTLLVQWALNDAVSPLFGLEPTGHAVRTVSSNLEVMNYAFEKALEEYFVSHLQSRAIFEHVIQNSHVQSLLRAAPGIQELFFLGRIFWLAELCEKERGWRYDRIVVDAPASGHGVALFAVPRSVSRMGIPGPITAESLRVSNLLENRNRVGTILVCTPEELPVEEMLELVPRIQANLGSVPLFAVVNRALHPALFSKGKLKSRACGEWVARVREKFSSPGVQSQFDVVTNFMAEKKRFEILVAEKLEELTISKTSILDVNFVMRNASAQDVIAHGSQALAAYLGGRESE